MGVAEIPKIHILKKPKLIKATELPKPIATAILPEKVDKKPNHKEKKTAELPNHRAIAILPER